MSFTIVVALLICGLAIGVFSGMVGIGGGLLVIPLLMVFFGFSQQKAAGTSLAMLLPPIGIFAVMAYARVGNIDWRYAALLAAGFAIGGYLGARLINTEVISPTVLRVGFALFLIYVASTLLFRAGGRARVALEVSAMVGTFLAAYVLFRYLGTLFLRHPKWGQPYRERLRHHIPREFDI